MTTRPNTAEAPGDTAIDRRITFHDETKVMEVDFSAFHFDGPAIVTRVYDRLESRIAASGQDLWFFLVNLNACQILPEAWVRHAHRGKRLNLAASLGTARFAAGSETEQDIRLRAQSEDFRPNIRNTRAEALELIEEIRAELLHR
jgi:hypothetical protein